MKQGSRGCGALAPGKEMVPLNALGQRSVARDYTPSPMETPCRCVSFITRGTKGDR